VGYLSTNGEEVKFRYKVKDYLIIMTDKRIIVEKGTGIRDIAASHITSVEIKEIWDYISVGMGLVILGVFIAAHGIIGVIALALVLGLVSIGLGIMYYGWKNKYILSIRYSNKSLSIRNGKELVELASKLREYVWKHA